MIKTSFLGRRKTIMTVAPNSGFETRLAYDGYAEYVIIEAINRGGEVLGASEILRIMPPHRPTKFIFDDEPIRSGFWFVWKRTIHNPYAIDAFEVVAGGIVVLGGYRILRRASRRRSWSRPWN